MFYSPDGSRWRISWNLRESLITTPVNQASRFPLSSNQRNSIEILVKVDTGAFCCIFELHLREALGFSIETGLRQVFGTATGMFVAYGQEVTLSVAASEFNTVAFFASDDGIRRIRPGPLWLARTRDPRLCGLRRQAVPHTLHRVNAILEYTSTTTNVQQRFLTFGKPRRGIKKAKNATPFQRQKFYICVPPLSTDRQITSFVW